ncbi:MAG: hypothetical protein HYX92_16610 [Chloroflexi bacterium]|nr:hypothetical protein [Chloroflexota bacterium]
MATAQGFLDYPIATIPHDLGSLDDMRHDLEAIERAAEIATGKVVSILTRGVCE